MPALLQFSPHTLLSPLYLSSKFKFHVSTSDWPSWLTVKSLPAVWETQVQSLGWEDPLEKEMVTHSSILAWRSHGWRSLAGYSPWGSRELDMTEQLHFLSFKSHPEAEPQDRISLCSTEKHMPRRLEWQKWASPQFLHILWGKLNFGPHGICPCVMPVNMSVILQGQKDFSDDLKVVTLS